MSFLIWSCGSWIYNYLCNQCLSLLMLWVRIWIRARCTTLCDKVCQWLAIGRRFSPGPPASHNLRYEYKGVMVFNTTFNNFQLYLGGEYKENKFIHQVQIDQKPCKEIYWQFTDKNTVVPVNIINKWSNKFDIEEPNGVLIFSDSSSLSKNNNL